MRASVSKSGRVCVSCAFSINFRLTYKITPRICSHISTQHPNTKPIFGIEGAPLQLTHLQTRHHCDLCWQCSSPHRGGSRGAEPTGVRLNPDDQEQRPSWKPEHRKATPRAPSEFTLRKEAPRAVSESLRPQVGPGC